MITWGVKDDHNHDGWQPATAFIMTHVARQQKPYSIDYLELPGKPEGCKKKPVETNNHVFGDRIEKTDPGWL